MNHFKLFAEKKKKEKKISLSAQGRPPLKLTLVTLNLT